MLYTMRVREREGCNEKKSEREEGREGGREAYTYVDVYIIRTCTCI